MGEQAISGLITVATAIIGVAIIATLVSRNANTAGVIASAGNALSQGLTAATAPVTSAGGFGFTGASPNFVSPLGFMEQ